MRLIAALALLALAAPAFAQEARVGDLVLERPAIREAPAGAPVAGGYLTIRNEGAEPDRLLSAASPAAGEVQIHEMAMEGGVMRMRARAEGVEIPAGEAVALEPGGLHLMLMDPAPMEAGQDVELTLTFERAGEVTAPFRVRTLGEIRAAEGGMNHSEAGHGAMGHAAPAAD